MNLVELKKRVLPCTFHVHVKQNTLVTRKEINLARVNRNANMGGGHEKRNSFPIINHCSVSYFCIF